MKTLNIPSEQAMQQLGQRMAKLLRPGDVVFLQGELGAGKTTLARGILQGLGYQDHIKSPTYTIVEPYQIDNTSVYHFDLYRINTPEELLDMGIEDYFNKASLVLIEWPEKASVLLPKPTVTCKIETESAGRSIEIEAPQNILLDSAD